METEDDRRKEFTRTVGVAILALLSTCCLTACRTNAAPAPLRVGTVVWIGSEPLQVLTPPQCASSNEIEMFQFNAGFDAIEKFRASKIDVVHVTLDEASIQRFRGLDIHPFLFMSASTGADVIVAKQEITSLAQLKKKTIGLEVGTVSHFFLLRALRKAGLSPQDVVLRKMAASEVVDALRNNRVDAMVTWEPYASDPSLAQYRRLFTSAELSPDEAIYDTLATSAKTLRERGAELKKLVSCWDKAVGFLTRSPEEAINALARVEESDAPTVRRRLATVKILNLDDNKALLGTTALSPSLIRVMEHWREFTVREGLVNGVAKGAGDDLIAPEIVRDLPSQPID